MTPQKRGSKWTAEEITFLKESLENAVSLQEIRKTISLRTPQAILTKANALGYGYYHNNNDGYTYFKKEIKHKKRRCKYEIEDVPIAMNDAIGADDKKGTVKAIETTIIPEKAINIAQYQGSVEFMLRSMRRNACLHL